MLSAYDLWPDAVRREFDLVIAKLPKQATAVQRRQALMRISPRTRDWLINVAFDEALRATMERRFQAAKSDEEAATALLEMPLPVPAATRQAWAEGLDEDEREGPS